MYLHLMKDAALLVALSAVYGLLGRRRGRGPWQALLVGALFGGVAVVGMSTPFEYRPGIFYDGRSIAMSMAGLFGGWVATIPSVVLAGAYRAYTGGPGVWAGLVSIAGPAMVGLAFRRASGGQPQRLGILPLYGLGVAAHVIVLADQLLLPWPRGLTVIPDIWLPIMVIFPVATVLMGLLLRMEDRRRAAEADLAWEGTLLNLLMDNLPDYIYFKDRASRFLRTSRSHARALGLSDPAEAVGKTDFDFYGPDHAAKAYDDEQRVLRTGIPLVDEEERETWPDRPDTWAITSKIPLTDASGAVLGTFGITHDNTQRKQLELKTQQLAALVEQADDAIVGIGLDRSVTVYSRGAARVYGYRAEEVLGKHASLFIPPEREEESREIQEKVLRGERVEQFETKRLHRSGARITVSLTLSAIRNPRGEIVGMASVARDITREKALREEASRAQRLESLTVLASGVAHNFNNINAVVKGYLDLLRADPQLPSRLGEYVDQAAASVRNASVITDHLLALTTPMGDPRSTVRLDRLARNVLAEAEARTTAEGVRVEAALDESPPAAGEEHRMRFVLAALVSNALDSLVGRTVRRIRVRTGRSPEGSFFEVEDSGCGIPERDLPKLFSPFYSGKGEWAAAGSSQSRLKGIGLNLAVSHALVTERGGRIDVTSAEGVGSVFRVVLPPPPPIGN